MSDVYYFDDLQIGQRFVSASRTMSEAEIKAFAREFDPQPFHLDAELATRSLFAGLSASGWHTAAVTMRLMVDGAAPIAGGVIGVGGEIEWPRPVRPGDTLQVHTEVVAAVPSRSRPDRGVVTIRCETRNQSGEPVQVFVGKLIVPKRPNPR